jgi:hypothetical protein
MKRSQPIGPIGMFWAISANPSPVLPAKWTDDIAESAQLFSDLRDR